MEVLLAITSGNNEEAVKLAKSFGWVKEDGSIKKNREREELEAKLQKIGIKIPWG
jgi:hypothetical protein